jgi:hypothetical protein
MKTIKYVSRIVDHRIVGQRMVVIRVSRCPLLNQTSEGFSDNCWEQAGPKIELESNLLARRPNFQEPH